MPSLPKLLRGTSVVLCAVLIFAGPASATAEKLRLVVTHAVPPLVPNSVIDLAQTLGFYEREGLQLDLVRVPHTPLALAALQTEYAHLADVSVSGALQLAAQKRGRIRAILAPGKAMPFLLVANSGVASLKDLEGKTLGIGGIGSLDHSMTRLVLWNLGVNPDKIKVVAIGEPQLRARALAAGRIEATTMSIGVWNMLRDHSDLRVLISPEAYVRAAPVLNKVIVADAATLAAKRRAIEMFISAIIRASRAFAQDAGLWVDAMNAVRPDVKRDELEELAHLFASRWSVNGGLNREQVGFSIEQYYRLGEFKGVRRVSVDELLDTGPVESVLSRLGLMPEMDANGR